MKKKSDPATTLGGECRTFPTTRESWIGDLASGEAQAHRRVVGELCRRYWKPIYWYVRGLGQKSNDEAKDLTQSFILWLLEEETLRLYSPLKGRFRPFVKVVLRRFLWHQEEARRRQKRGGQAHVFSFDEFPGSSEVYAAPSARDLEGDFDRAWAKELARRAIERVREKLLGKGQGVKFEIYSSIDLREAERAPSYREVASQVGLDEEDVRNYLRDVRALVREELRGDLAETVGHPHEIAIEWGELFGS